MYKVILPGLLLLGLTGCFEHHPKYKVGDCLYTTMGSFKMYYMKIVGVDDKSYTWKSCMLTESSNPTNCWTDPMTMDFKTFEESKDGTGKEVPLHPILCSEVK